MTLPMTANQQRTTWDRYSAAWKAPTREEKKAALRESTNANAIYRDPLVETADQTALVDYMLAFHQQIPGGHFEVTSFQAHHDRCFARWNMLSKEGAVLGVGHSFGEFDPDGMLRAMTGFFETPPQ